MLKFQMQTEALFMKTSGEGDSTDKKNFSTIVYKAYY